MARHELVLIIAAVVFFSFLPSLFLSPQVGNQLPLRWGIKRGGSPRSSSGAEGGDLSPLNSSEHISC